MQRHLHADSSSFKHTTPVHSNKAATSVRFDLLMSTVQMIGVDGEIDQYDRKRVWNRFACITLKQEFKSFFVNYVSSRNINTSQMK
jgi:hypothetical protein